MRFGITNFGHMYSEDNRSEMQGTKMSIVEKKCPNCGANLKFKYGDHDAHCESCRSDFAIEYEPIEPENSSKSFGVTAAEAAAAIAKLTACMGK